MTATLTAAEIVEEVATTIHAGLLGDDPLTEIAKAAVLATLDAICEPSKAMVEAGARQIFPIARGVRPLGDAWKDYSKDAIDSFRAMIDALRKGIAG